MTMQPPQYDCISGIPIKRVAYRAGIEMGSANGRPTGNWRGTSPLWASRTRSRLQDRRGGKARSKGGFGGTGNRFVADDFAPVASFGDRTLSRYRSMARKALPPEEAGAMAAAPEDPVRAVLDEVLEEFERVHLLLRLSTRLRQLHGD